MREDRPRENVCVCVCVRTCVGVSSSETPTPCAAAPKLSCICPRGPVKLLGIWLFAGLCVCVCVCCVCVCVCVCVYAVCVRETIANISCSGRKNEERRVVIVQGCPSQTRARGLQEAPPHRESSHPIRTATQGKMQGARRTGPARALCRHPKGIPSIPLDFPRESERQQPVSHTPPQSLQKETPRRIARKGRDPTDTQCKARHATYSVRPVQYEHSDGIRLRL